MIKGSEQGRKKGLKTHLPDCKVCFPPDNTPRGRVPVGVRPLSVNTFSLSSLVHKQNITLQEAGQQHAHLVVKRLFGNEEVVSSVPVG